MSRSTFPTTKPQRAFADYPAATRLYAERAKKVAEAFFKARAAGKNKTRAGLDARTEWLQLFGQAASERTIFRLAQKVERAGGIATAPMETYCHGKSCPHPRQRLAYKAAVPALPRPAQPSRAETVCRAAALISEACGLLAAADGIACDKLKLSAFDALAGAAGKVGKGA